MNSFWCTSCMLEAFSKFPRNEVLVIFGRSIPKYCVLSESHQEAEMSACPFVGDTKFEHLT